MARKQSAQTTGAHCGIQVSADLRVSAFVYGSMRMMCQTRDFGDQLFDMLTPLDLSCFLVAFRLKLSKIQSARYMPLWRQFFTSKSWMPSITSQGFELYLVGNDLATLISWIKLPELVNSTRRRLHMDLRLSSCSVLRTRDLLSCADYSPAVNAIYERLDEFIVQSDHLTDALDAGIVVNYSGFLISDGRIAGSSSPEPWVDLTITSTMKVRKHHVDTRLEQEALEPDISIGLWYGRETLQSCDFSSDFSWMPCTAETGIALKIDDTNSMALDGPLRRSWDITRLVSRRSSTGGHLYEEIRGFDCTAMLEARDKVRKTPGPQE